MDHTNRGLCSYVSILYSWRYMAHEPLQSQTKPATLQGGASNDACKLFAENADAQVAMILAFRGMIMAKHPFLGRKPPKPIQGILPCPRCGKDCRYMISSYNGHIAAKCLIKDCFCFQE